MPISFDFSGSGAGYLASPSKGSLAELVRLVDNMGAGIRTVRRLGVSVEYATQARHHGIFFHWGSSWVDAYPCGLRHTFPSGMSHTFLDGLRACGIQTLCIGATASAKDLDNARSAATPVAIEPGKLTVRSLSECSLPAGSTLESLRAAGLAAAEMHGLLQSATDVAPSAQAALLALGRLPASRVALLADTIAQWRLPISPLMAQTRYQSDLAALLTASGLDDLSRVLPHHNRVLALRVPGAMAMGRRDALKHLGLVSLGRSDKAQLARGWDLLKDLLMCLSKQVWLVGGTGAPGLGLNPACALSEERRIWESAGVDADVIYRAFTSSTWKHLFETDLPSLDRYSSGGSL